MINSTNIHYTYDLKSPSKLKKVEYIFNFCIAPSLRHCRFCDVTPAVTATSPKPSYIPDEFYFVTDKKKIFSFLAYPFCLVPLLSIAKLWKRFLDVIHVYICLCFSLHSVKVFSVILKTKGFVFFKVTTMMKF